MANYPLKVHPWTGVVACTVLLLAFPAALGMRAVRGRVKFFDARPVAVLAKGRGNPWVGFQDGLELPARYQGPAESRELLERGLAMPRALGSADCDEDGVPDLICGYSVPGGGILAVYRGNVRSIWPAGTGQNKPPEPGDQSPFLTPARVFQLPDSPDFIGMGDFDGDGHFDVVTAARGADQLLWLSGNGQGEFSPAHDVKLPGAVTTVFTGEINRRDGLEDVVVGLKGTDGSKVLVFEWPEGALRGQPEIFSLPQAPTSLATGFLDDAVAMGLAIAAGDQLVIIHGRDRKLSLDRTCRASVRPAVIERHSFPFAIRSLALGHFTPDQTLQEQIALLGDDGAVHLVKQSAAHSGQPREQTEGWHTEQLTPGGWPGAAGLIRARVGSLPSDGLLVLDPANDQLHIVNPRAKAATSGPKFNTATLDVLGEPIAILFMRLNPDALTDLVILRAGTTAPVVALTAPMTTYSVVTTGDSGPGSLRRAILNANARPGADMIVFNIPGAGTHTIAPTSPLPEITDPVMIDGTTQPGYAGSPVVALDCSDAGFANGLRITGGSSVVRALAIHRFRPERPFPPDPRYWTGFGIVLAEAGGNIVEGNLIGTDLTGTVASGGGEAAVLVISPANIIGGTLTKARNVLSGATESPFGMGLMVRSAAANRNQIQGNYVGTDISGLVGIPNGRSGITVQDARVNSIGGTTAGSRNVIVGNDTGIELKGAGAEGNLIQGNSIGLNAAGVTSPTTHNESGIVVSTAFNTIGGTSAAARNIISGNDRGAGVTLTLDDVDPVLVRDNLVQGNFIGTDSTGLIERGNFHGVAMVSGFATANTVGGVLAATRNIISGNRSFGVSFEDAAFGNRLQGNFIGLNALGTASLGNRLDGVECVDDTSNNAIGGRDAGAGNVIAYNGSSGVSVSLTDIGNAILSNSIYSNGALGINLVSFESGVATNDPGDADTGANELQNYPELTSVSIGADGRTTIRGRLDSHPATHYRIEFFANLSCNPYMYGEGARFLGFMDVTTGGDGISEFTFSAAGLVVCSDSFVTATATDPNGNTSEFSRCLAPTRALLCPRLRITPTPLDFTRVGLGGSLSRPITVDNTGQTTVMVRSLMTTDPQFSVVSPQGSFELVPGGQRQITLRFSPTMLGIQAAALMFDSNDPDAPRGDLRGDGVPGPNPDIDVSPSRLHFDPVMVGASNDQTLTVKNVGEGPLMVNRITSNVSAFTIVAPNGPFSVAAGRQMNVTVRFTPTEINLLTGALTIESNDPDEPELKVPVSGEGTQPKPDIDVSTFMLEFGHVQIGSSMAMTFTVKNLGTSTLVVNSLSVTGSQAFTAPSPVTPFNLAPNQQQVVTVKFSPTPNTPGNQNATLTIFSNDPDEPQVKVSLAGFAGQ